MPKCFIKWKLYTFNISKLYVLIKFPFFHYSLWFLLHFLNTAKTTSNLRDMRVFINECRRILKRISTTTCLVSAIFIPYEIPVLLQEQPYKNALSILATSYNSTDIQPSTQSQPIFLIFESPSCMLSTGLHMIELRRGGSRILNRRELIWGDTCTLTFLCFLNMQLRNIRVYYAQEENDVACTREKKNQPDMLN